MIEKENDTRLKEQDTENDNRETFVWYDIKGK